MELRIGGHKTVHADYVSYICQILVLYNVGPYAWDSRRLRILNESMSMCDLLLPTGFKGSNVITNQRCDNVLGFMMRVLGNWLWRIYHYYSTRTWILIKHPFYLLYFISIYVANMPSYFCHFLREKCPNTEIFLVRIFLYPVQMQGNAERKNLRVWTLFTKCESTANNAWL